MAGIGGMVVRYLRGTTAEKRPKASIARIRSWIDVMEESWERREYRVLGMGEEV